MKGAKWRYDEKKLSKSSALKKQIALLLASDYVKTYKLDTVEIIAFGLKERPFGAYSEKALIKAFDELYMKKVADLDRKKQELKDYIDDGGRRTWSYEDLIDTVQKEIDVLQPYIDELIEEAFSE